MVLEIRDKVRELTSLDSSKVCLGVAPLRIKSPFIVVTELPGTTDTNYSGPDGTGETVIRVAVYSDTYGESYDLSEELRPILSMNTNTLKYIQRIGGADIYDSEQKLHGIIKEYRVRYLEEV